MTCWKCGAQTIEKNTCTVCGCVQDTRQPAETPRGKAMRYIYDKLGPSATLANPSNFIRCLGDVFPDDDEFRKKMAQVLKTNVGIHLYSMLSENKEIDENAHRQLMQIVRNKCSLSDEKIGPSLYLLLDMVGCTKVHKSAPTNGFNNTVAGGSSAAEKKAEIERPFVQPVPSTAGQTKTSSPKGLLPVIGILAIVAFGLAALFSLQQSVNTPSKQTSYSTSAKSSNDDYIPSRQAIPYEFTLEGITYKLPCLVSQFLANGWQIYTYDENHGAVYFSGDHSVEPGDFGYSPVSTTLTYAFKGTPGDYSFDGSYRLAPSSDYPSVGIKVSNPYTNTRALKDCYITEIAVDDFLDKHNFSFTWNNISLNSSFSEAKRKVDALRQRCEPVTNTYNHDNYIGFGVEAALERYQVYISSDSDKKTNYISLSHHITPK